jgi:hypothetical protein
MLPPTRTEFTYSMTLNRIRLDDLNRGTASVTNMLELRVDDVSSNWKFPRCHVRSGLAVVAPWNTETSVGWLKLVPPRRRFGENLRMMHVPGPQKKQGHHYMP